MRTRQCGAIAQEGGALRWRGYLLPFVEGDNLWKPTVEAAAELNMQSSGYSQYDNCPAGPYTYGPGKSGNPCDTFHFWSMHPGGANFIFDDGSVHFLSYGIGANLVKLATRDGQEAYSDW